jgi:protein phosphatase 1L
MVLTHKLEKKGATAEEIEKAMYLAALSQFCIYNPSQKRPNWPLRDGDPLHKSAMTKHSCTLHDFHRALRARDPLGWGFEANDSLLHLIWQLLAWNPEDRISATEALRHPYFSPLEIPLDLDAPLHWNALESQMLDPRMDFNISDSIDEFICPKCGRRFSDWQSCHKHVHSRKHAKFCTYDRSALPTCLNAHSMLPAHSYSGYCDIQGRRRTIEDFHAIHLLPYQQFYGIFDGHLGNFASKYAASFLYGELSSRLSQFMVPPLADDWKMKIKEGAGEAFDAVHEKFLKTIGTTTYRYGFMDSSGTTATALLACNETFVIASLGDSRAVLSKQNIMPDGRMEIKPIQLTKDHVASDFDERKMVESKGGTIVQNNGVGRVNGTLVITRSIGDAGLAPVLSRIPHVISMTKKEILELCGAAVDANYLPCFLILASDGLWDTVDNQEAVELVADVVMKVSKDDSNWREAAGLQRAAEALTVEAYVRGSSDNIGVCIIAIE